MREVKKVELENNYLERTPKKYDVCINAIGLLGMIVEDTARSITYDDGNIADTWYGIHLLHDVATLKDGRKFEVKPGEQWTARNPKILYNLYEINEDLGLIWRDGSL